MTEFNSPLYSVFVDYEKVFDRVSRESIWHALKRKGIPPKLIAMIKAQYDGFKCSLAFFSKLSEPSNTASGVRQGCILSPLLFFIVIDDILNRAVERKMRGIWWKPFQQLEDLDYADEIVQKYLTAMRNLYFCMLVKHGQ
jgi:hypothetical protein